MHYGIKSIPEPASKIDRSVALCQIRAHGSALQTLRQLYAKKTTTLKDRLIHRKSVLAVIHQLHCDWEKVWEHDLSEAQRNSEMGALIASGPRR